MTQPNHEALKAAAEKATISAHTIRWLEDVALHFRQLAPHATTRWISEQYRERRQAAEEAVAWIGAASPSAVLELIAENESLLSQLEASRAEVEAKDAALAEAREEVERFAGINAIVQYVTRDTGGWATMAAFDSVGAAERYVAKCDPEYWEYRTITRAALNPDGGA